jgi:hypothetical protein
MSIREHFLENFAGDLEFNPKRAILYAALSAASFLFWYRTPAPTDFTALPLTFALGSLPLLVKAIFLLRKSSEGLALTHPQIAPTPSAQSAPKVTPSLPHQAAQLLQDFATGPLLLPLALNSAKDINPAWTNPPQLHIFLIGLALFATGFTLRRLT